jgi:hypothetical protein
MAMNVKYCKKCQRPLWFSKGPYCLDCTEIVASNKLDIRCKHCGKNALESSLFYNRKRETIYCRGCLDVFLNELRTRGFTDTQVRKIVREDFQAIQKGVI